MESRTSFRRIAALVLALAMGWTAAARAQDEVRLRGSVEIEAGRALVLGDVAELSGSAAEALGGVVVLEAWPAGAAWTTLELAAVRDALKKCDKVNWGRLSLNGSSCTVRQAAKAPAAAPAAAASPAAKAAEPAAAGGKPRVRDLVAPRLSALLSVEESSLRLSFEESAGSLLDTVVEGRVVEITPSGMADKLPVTIRVFEKDRVVASGSVRVGVAVRREVLVAKAALKRGDALELKDAAIETRWVGPTAATAGLGDLGSVVKAGKLSAGQLILETDLTPAVVVRKGEMVSVSCISGSVVLKTLARAASDARKGEVVKFEGAEKGKTKREFLARVDGPGRAVTVAAGTAEAEPLAQDAPAGPVAP